MDVNDEITCLPSLSSRDVEARVKEMPPTEDTSKFKRPWHRSVISNGACCLFSCVVWAGVWPGDVTWSIGEEPWKSQASSHCVVPSNDMFTTLLITLTAKTLSVGTMTRRWPWTGQQQEWFKQCIHNVYTHKDNYCSPNWKMILWAAMRWKTH